MEPLRQILYTSLARPELSLDDLRAITMASARNNALDGLRGRLFFTGRGFCQVVEGVDRAITAALGRIKGSPLHYDLIIHSDRNIEQYTMTSWVMAAERLDQATALQEALEDACPGIGAPIRDSAIERLKVGGFGSPSFLEASDQKSARIVELFEAWVKGQQYPCVGAKSAIAKQQMTAYVGRDLRSSWDDVAIVSELVRFAHDYAQYRTMFQTFVVFFPDTPLLDEQSFEAALWERIDSLQHKDVFFGQIADPSVSHDPNDPMFSLSFGGQSFFVVGLHPAASRPARRFSVPALVFNLHDQFVRLRADGRYEGMRETILTRDEQLAGTRNPMLSRHGEVSEARQYSGRIVGPDWECPFAGRPKE